MNRNNKFKFSFLCNAFAFAILIIMLSDILQSYKSDKTPFILTLLIIYAFLVFSFYVLYITYTAGYTLFSLLFGAKPIGLILFGFTIYRKNGRLTAKWAPKSIYLCAIITSEIKAENKKKAIAWIHAGGQIIALAVALAFFLLYRISPEASHLQCLCGTMYCCHFYLFLKNAFPYKNEVSNTASHIRYIIRHPEYAEICARSIALTDMLLTKGIRERNVPGYYYYIPSDDDLSDPMKAGHIINYIEHIIDTHDFDRAKDFIDGLYEKNVVFNVMDDALARSERIFLEIIGDGDKNTVARLLTPECHTYMTKTKGDVRFCRTRYALALSEGNAEKIKKYKKKYQTEIQRLYTDTEAEAENELLGILEKKYPV